MSGARANCLAMWSRENRAGDKSSDSGRVRGGAWDGGRQIERQTNGVKVRRKARNTGEKKVKSVDLIISI